MNANLQGTSGSNALAAPMGNTATNPQIHRAPDQIIARKTGCEAELFSRWPTGEQKPYWYAKRLAENKIEPIKIQ